MRSDFSLNIIMFFVSHSVASYLLYGDQIFSRVDWRHEWIAELDQEISHSVTGILD